MLVEVAAFGKLPVAAGVRAFEGPIACVCALMNGKAANNAERLVASRKIALIGALIGMRTHVLCQGACLAKALVANRTYVRPVTRVCLDMSQYLLLLLKLAPMLGAFAADPATFVFGLTGTHVHFGNVRSKLSMSIKAFCTMDPATRVLFFALFVGGAQTGRHNIFEQTLGHVQRSLSLGICRRPRQGLWRLERPCMGHRQLRLKR